MVNSEQIRVFENLYNVPRETIDQFTEYHKLLIESQERTNLVGSGTISSIWTRHFSDSAKLTDKIISHKNKLKTSIRVCDVGSGAGFPGIPLAIFNPGKHFTLIDGNGKKTRFLFQVKLTLDLSSIQIRNCRVEHYQTDRQIDMVVTRAVSGIHELVDKICHFVSKDCRILFMKGMASKEDISSLPQDFEIVNVEELKILGRTRHVIEIGRK